MGNICKANFINTFIICTTPFFILPNSNVQFVLKTLSCTQLDLNVAIRPQCQAFYNTVGKRSFCQNLSSCFNSLHKSLCVLNKQHFSRNKYTSPGVYVPIILEPELHCIDLLFTRKLPFTGSSFKHTKCQDTPKSHNTLYLWRFYSQHDYNTIKPIHQWEMCNYFLRYWNRRYFAIKIQSYQNVIATAKVTSNQF